MKILGSEVLWCVFGRLVQDGLAHMRSIICSGKVQNRMSEMKTFGSEVCSVLGRWFRMGWLTCVV